MIRAEGIETRTLSGDWSAWRGPLLIEPGQGVSLLGGSGTGKTSFCLMLLGFSDPAQAKGTILFNGRNVLEISDAERARFFAYVPTDPTLLFTGIKSSVLGELKLAWQLLGQIPTAGQHGLDALIENFGLHDLLNRDPLTLSGGEAARAAIAIAAAKRPAVLALDQSYDNLDRAAITDLRSALLRHLPEDSIIVETYARKPDWLRSFAGAVDAGQSRRILIEPLTSLADRDYVHCHRIPRRRCDSTDHELSPILRVDNLEYSYPNGGFTLAPISFDLHGGDRAALTGPNGAGKTTILKSIAMLLDAQYRSLQIRTAESQVSSPRPKRLDLWARNALYVFQNPDDQLYLSSVRKEITETALRLDRADANISLEIAHALGLTRFLDQSPFELPRPYRRLVCIASALAAQTPILLLDEPSAGLDDAGAEFLAKALVTFRPQHAATIIVSHDEAFLEVVANRTIQVSTAGLSVN